MKTEKRIKKWIWVAIVSLLPQLAGASGFGIFVNGASTLGEGLSSSAHTNNPHAIFFNPALINQLEGTQIEGGTTLVAPYHDFHSDASGISDTADNVVFFPATLYVTHQYSEKLSLGFGLFTPFGLGTKWDDDWEGRYINIDTEVQTLNFNPVFSYRLSPVLSLAAGLDMLYVDASLEKRLNFSTLGFDDGRQKLAGDGTGYGYNLGLYSQLSDDLALGVSYRSGIKVELKGNVEFGLPSSVLAPNFPDSSVETRIDFPDHLHAALAYSGLERLVIEAGIRWENWSNYNELKFKTAKVINSSTVSVIPKDWHDTLTLTVGGRYALNDRVRLLAGFLRGQDPIPNKTFEPAITDSPHYALTAGAEYSIGRHQLAFVYAWQKWFERDKDNEVGADATGGAVSDARANGKYNLYSHFLALSFTYVF